MSDAQFDMFAALNHAASILGTKIISSKDHQCLIESNSTFMKFFERHPMNRHVDMDWVKELKSEMMKMIMAKECTMIDLAVSKIDIETAVKDADPTKDQGGFKAIILDGQHRMEALKQIANEIPANTFDIWLRVFIVDNDEDVINRIEILNKRRGFNQSDIDKQATNKNFLAAVEKKIGTANLRRQYYIKLKKAAKLNDKTWVNNHKNMTVTQFCNKLDTIAQDHYARYLGMIKDQNGSDTKFSKSAIGQIIKESKMFQFIVEDPNEWIGVL